MRSAQLAYENRLASTAGGRVEQLSPRLLPLAVDKSEGRVKDKDLLPVFVTPRVCQRRL